MNNIFNILASADKELVHSAMLKFILDSDYLANDFLTNVIGISNLQFKGNTELEQSDKNPQTNKKIRFDLLIRSSKDNKTPILLIENKFKATPTVEQLKLYDDYFESKGIHDIHKVLFVFSKSQLSTNVSDYCHNRWKVVSYVTFVESKEGNHSLLSWLKDAKTHPELDERSKLLINDYYDYLRSLEEEINKLVGNITYVRNKNKSNRFIHFQYLLYIQGLISKQLLGKESLNITADNDGGKNIIPSIAFWMGVTNANLKDVISAFASIDGNTFKLGINYYKNDKEDLSSMVTLLRDNWKTKKFKTLIPTKNNQSLKSADQSNKEKEDSVYAIFTFQIKQNAELTNIVSEIAEISVDYFKNYT
jgi:PD-(D/E)XK nuclease superfamily